MSIKQNLFNKIQDAAKFAAPSTSFWQQILTFLKEEWKVDEDHLSHYFVRQGDAIDDSIIATVEVNADLGEDAWTAIYEDADFWNESINNIIGQLKKLQSHSDDLFAPWKWEDIRYANAAIDFSSDYVKPKNNIDGFAYAAVRGNDKFTYVLNNKANLQFTHTQPNEDGTFPPFAKWLRLIMPKNTRRVEIEDLDRNFWVIGQSLSIISKYLFDDNSPLAKILGDMLHEITEQWENMLYLWTDYAAITGRNQDIKLVLDLPVDEFHPYRKFDGFEEDEWSSMGTDMVSGKYIRTLEARFGFLTQKYGKSRISLLVRKRELNYKNNYYSREMYPYYGYYDGDKWTWYPIFYSTTDNRLFRANINDYKYFVYAYNANTKEYGRYSVTNRPTIAVRIMPSIERGGINPKINFKFYDAVEAMIKGQSSSKLLKTYEGEVSGNFIQIVKTQDSTHTRPNPPKYFVAHRGYQTEKNGTKASLDNTLPNFRRAIEAGFDYLETDIRFGNNCCVLSHNRQVEIDGQTIDVSTLSQSNHWVENNNHNKRFPLLSDLLTLSENTESITTTKRTLKKPLYLEIKIPTSKYIFPTSWKDYLANDIINSKVGVDQISWICFDADILIELASHSRLINSNTRLGYLVDSSHREEMTNLQKLKDLITASNNQTKFKVFVDFSIDTLNDHQDIYAYCNQNNIPIETYTIDTKAEYDTLGTNFTKVTSNDITPYTIDMETGKFDRATVDVNIYPGEVMTMNYEEWM